MRVCIVLAVLMVLGGCAQHGPILAPRINAVAAPTRVELDDVPFFPQRDYQCGPAALATVLTYADQPTTPDELVPAVYLPGRKGSLQVEMVAATRNHGRIGYVLAPTLAALLEELQAGRPVVVLQNLGLESVPIWHFAVVVGYSSVDETFILRSGTERRRVMPALKFMRSWVLGQQWAFVPLKPGELPAGDDADRYLRAVSDFESVRGAAGPVPAYQAAVNRWPDHRTLRFGLANALRAAGDPAAALRELTSLALAAPDDVIVLNNLADLLRERGCRTRASAIIGQAVAAAPSSGRVRTVLEQTRAEIDAMPSADAADCPR